jgi:hypothetical protein
MATRRWLFCAAVALLSALAITSASRAGDLSAPDLVAGSSLSTAPDGVRQTDAGEAVQAPGDDASKVTDLETRRAAIDRRAGPALSLSVTGWVAEQVIRAH